jgi:cell division initiation protein
MELTSADVQHKTFRMCWRGLDPKEVGIFLNEIAEEIQRLRSENAEQRMDFQHLQAEVKEHKEREKAIRNVLLNVHKTAEQMKANAEKEAQLITADAELKAEKILQEARERLGRINGEIAELKRQRVQLETKLRSIVDVFQRLLDHEMEEEATAAGTDNRHHNGEAI